MHILVVGFNYKTAPVELREKFSFQESELPDALKQLRNMKSILECTVISTCNRTEVYVVADQLHTGRHFTKTFLAEWFGLQKEEFLPYLTIREDQNAIEHLFRVTCGLDSMILGETQILGQVRDSFLLAQEQQATGTIFNHVFKQAVTLAKRAHSGTEIGQHAVSVSYAAVELGKNIFGDFSGKHVVILGAGEMSELTAKHLHSNGADKITVVNRTEAKAAELAAKFLGQARPFEKLQETLAEADVVISSTGARDFVVTKEMLAGSMKKRKGRPLFMVDIAVPRDLDPMLADFDDVYLYDIDDLQNIVEANLAERKREAEKIEIMIEAEIDEFKSWLNTLGVVPIITALRTKALVVQAETMESIERKLPHLSERDKKVLRKHTKSIVNQLLRDPVTRVKELAAQPDADEALDLFTKIFALEGELTVQEEDARIEEVEMKWETQKQEYATVPRQHTAVVRS
ncbi:glutamyl-tRNA reductase [Halalkalibacter nanhaiisediminis]|uniref:Glutamyl-tRNA reductase n=1 Tax=Halalkalibacter nanhaiisediminis TaxID=688079 RepID=A0A562QLZ6_9BACI|nr:glutamyl-tRNA reductase [Halalkalibacter nanhaiisediminis]TWI57076.1 glutamyl-tRNA reductase [Halalkalibacter nanhaiisediminis]